MHSLCAIIMIKLTNRLKMVADMVPHCEKVVDVGTDHAYLPVYLIENKICDMALACDINEGPLNNADKTIKKYKLNSQINTRLSNGLDKVKGDEADTVVIAGMGGILISEIISTKWLKDSKKQLVLQPMTHIYDVRKYLCENGYDILDEQTTQEGKHIYYSVSAKYSGKENIKPQWYYYFGDLLKSKKQSDIDFCNKIILSLNKKYEALKALPDNYETDKLKKVLEEIKNEQCL